MTPGLLVKLRPSAPWRFGSASGERDRVDTIFHSDTLYSAVTHAMRLLGKLEYWLEVTAGSEPAQVRFSSMFPFHGEMLYVTPPRHIWPPAPSVRVRYSGARFVPAELIESIFAGKPLENDRWSLDGESATLVPGTRPGPFRVRVRSAAAVDRWTGAAEPHATACLEFVPKAGLWFAVQYADPIARDQWNDSLRSAIRLLADSGFGGERSRGWGRAFKPEFRDGTLPELIYKGPAGEPSLHWMLGVLSPAASDEIEWDRGVYGVSVRGGRINSPVASGAAKKLLTVIEEGSVLAANRLQGAAPDVRPEGFPHPVYHAGFAFSIPVPAEVPKQIDLIEEPPMPIEEAEVISADQAAAEEIALPEDAGEAPAHLEEAETLDYAVAERPEEVPVSHEELEQLENQDPGGPDDDLMPPMNDPGPMEPPFREPEDLTPIDPDRREPDEPAPGPNPDEPGEPGGPQE